MEENSPKVTLEDIASVDAWFWAYNNRIRLQSGEFKVDGHEYLIEPMQSQAQHRVMKKGAQMGFTEAEVLRTLHGMMYGYYPLGVLYLFPTSDDVLDFGKTRFKGLLERNPAAIGCYVGNTETAELKQIGKGYLYLRGARVGSKIEGLKKESTKLRSIPVDKVVFDEVDLMDPAMIDMARERMSHSEIRQETYLSTPTIPDFGIDKIYQESDQRVWRIKCEKCGNDCCLELDFPSCVKFKDGKAYRACIKCGAEIHPSKGRWIAENERSDVAGWWISQLNSIYIDPGQILKLYENPPNGNLQEVYNSKLAMPYIATQNRLTKQDVYACCGQHPLSMKDNGPCAMGIDVQGPDLKVVIGKKLAENKIRIVWIGSVPDFGDAVELGQRFNVKHCAVDMYPETRRARDFQANGIFSVTLCYYLDRVKEGEKTDNFTGTSGLARTEICDTTHQKIISRLYELPRRCPEVDEYAKQMSNLAKILEQDERRGVSIYRYRKLGPDHFRHSTNYLQVALTHVGIASDNPFMDMLRQFAIEKTEYNPLTFGLA